jgi:dihydroxyacid dehydratase/phosphogluconate dehydratase
MTDDLKNTIRRNRSWYGKQDKDGFIHRSWMKNQGFPDHAFDGRPVIGICNTWSELTPCNSGLRTLAEGVKRGVWEAGGFPVEFPVMSLGETQMKPTAMLFRNLLAMDVEESIRAYGVDGGCLGRFAIDCSVVRADAERQVARQRYRFWHRRLAVLRSGACW